MARGIRGFHGSESDQEQDRIVILLDRKTMEVGFEDEEYVIQNEHVIFCALQNAISWMQASRSVEATKQLMEQVWNEDPENDNNSQ